MSLNSIMNIATSGMNTAQQQQVRERLDKRHGRWGRG